MIDLILFLYSLGLFVAGYWVGKTSDSWKAAAWRSARRVRGCFRRAPKP